MNLPVRLYAATKADEARAKEEAALGMLAPQHPLLAATADYVTLEALTSARIKTVIDRLYIAASGQRRQSRATKKRRTLVGLAAPQIGESLRIIIADTHVSTERKRYGQLECFINPRIIWRSRETAEDREGCFSTGLVWGLVRRPLAIKMAALTPEGKHVERVFEGFTARIIQHEIDHLDGIRFPERIRSDRKRHWVHAEEIDAYPKEAKHWPRVCTMERWEAYKRPVKRAS